MSAPTSSSKASDIRYAVGEPAGHGPLWVLCPFHADTSPSMAVYPDGSWCFVCGKGETAQAFLERIGYTGTPLPPRKQERQRNAFDPRASALMCDIWHHTLVHGPRRERIDWLLQRGIWYATILEQKLGHTGERFVIPIGGERHLGYKLRADPKYTDPDAPKYIQRTAERLALYQPYPRRNGVRVICEGELDALVLHQLGYAPVTAVSGAGSLAETLRRNGYAPPRNARLVIATDQDEAGEAAAEELLRHYPWAVRAHWEGANDISELYVTHGYRGVEQALMRTD